MTRASRLIAGLLALLWCAAARADNLTLLGASGGFVGILDQVPGATVAVSLHCLRAAYCPAGKAVNERRNQDSVQQDIGFLAGAFNAAAFIAFLNGSSPASTTGFTSTAYDQSGNTFNAAQSTAADQAPLGLIGGLYFINFASAKWLQISDNASSLRPSSFTIAAWFNTTSFATDQTIVAKNYVSEPWTAPFATILIRIDSSSGVEIGLSDGFAFTTNTFIVSSIPPNTWTHIAFTYNGSVGTLYINGLLVGSYTYSLTLGYSTQAWTVGADNSAIGGDSFNGNIDQVLIYPSVLASTQIAMLAGSLP